MTARSHALALAVAVLGLLLMAPTPGDTGGCGRTATELDRDRYASARKQQDCTRCEECELTTARCVRACDPKQLPELELPVTCRPLFHDGAVCLRALAAASCERFATYVEDAPANPTECDFCQVAPPAPPPAFGDGGSGVSESGEGGAP